ncbi:L-asparaginase 1-like [Anabrus simplex]|uniref:L-asparaginase 1-like n=1 Tax=Anabrus simplex TaxID=316456 RepID=UPI0034DD8000
MSTMISCSTINLDKPESKVMVIYTGGTIGMLRNEDGVLAPAPNMLIPALKNNPYLHDKLYAEATDTTSLVLPDCDEKYRVIYTVLEYDPLLDSSNMTVDDWMHIGKDIRDHYEKYDGFVILHGTDTLAYSASALSFMFENIGKSVIMTGSQIPIFEIRGDGLSNMLGSLILAGNYIIPEVTVYFNNKLLRGNRTSKVHVSSLNAFDSPNFPPLATVGIKIEVNTKAIFHQCDLEKFRVQSVLNKNVCLLRLFPCITTSTIQEFLRPPAMGVVLQTYGSGNVPSNRKDLLDEISEATSRGVLVVNITQCTKGSVSDIYETGEALKKAGVIPGFDMTPEAALTKLTYTLSKPDWDTTKKREMMQANIRGELTSHDQFLHTNENDFVDIVAHALNINTSEERKQLGAILYPAIASIAVSDGNTEMLDNLKKYGVDFSASNMDDRTALHLACCEGNLAIVEYLISHGVSVHAKDRFDHTPLLDAIQFDHHDVIQLLVQSGAHLIGNPRVIGGELCKAAAKGNKRRLESLFLAGADMNQPDFSERTALHMAALHDHPECVSFLLLHKARTDAVDLLKLTPLDMARMKENKHVAELLEFAREDEDRQKTDLGIKLETSFPEVVITKNS